MHKSARFLALTSAAILALAPAAGAQQCQPPAGQAYELALSSSPGANLKTAAFKTRITVNGQQREVLIDTGSSAINVPAALLQGVTPAVTGVYYSYVSSGRIYKGNWYLVKVTLPTIGATPGLSTDTLAVFGTTDTCSGTLEAPTDCLKLDPSDPLGMMGVSYNPYSLPTQVQGNPTNAFLALPATAANPGYVITASRVWLGIDGRTTGQFGQLPVTADKSGRLSPSGCISYTVGGNTGAPLCGTLLMDTGINHLYLTMPPNSCPPKSAVAVQVTAPDPAGAVLNWSYAANFGQATTSAAGSSGDNCVQETGTGGTNHTNTGRMVLAQYDYLYDGTCKAVGFRPVKPQ
ncbi:MAG TPA: hypothetical protein VED40_21840 [Azospirillaceae bacterium]|nr:hypothetical protein [Azospirillaceae bacterium]